MRPQTCPVISSLNPSGVLFLHPSGERSKAPSILSQGPPRSKPSSLPFQWCNSVLPLRNPHSYIIRYSPRPAGPKLLKYKKAAFVLLDTSSLRQNPRDSITVSAISTHQGEFIESHLAGSSSNTSVQGHKSSAPGAPWAEIVMGCVESVCNSASYWEWGWILFSSKQNESGFL